MLSSQNIRFIRFEKIDRIQILLSTYTAEATAEATQLLWKTEFCNNDLVSLVIVACYPKMNK